MTRESEIQSRIQLRATQLGARLFRNVTAQAVVGRIEGCNGWRTVAVQPGDFIVRQGRIINAGLAIGSGDLIGWTPTQHGALFTSVEVKTPKGRMSEEQRVWLRNVAEAGGIAGVCRSVEDYERLHAAASSGEESPGR